MSSDTIYLREPKAEDLPSQSSAPRDGVPPEGQRLEVEIKANAPEKSLSAPTDNTQEDAAPVVTTADTRVQDNAMGKSTPTAVRTDDSGVSQLDDLDQLADWLDSRYQIPGTSIRFGWDSILGLIPGIGDTAALLPALYLIATGYKRGASTGTLVRMGVNTGLDYFVGGIPVLGDIFDLFFKANRRNIALLKTDLSRVAP